MAGREAVDPAGGTEPEDLRRGSDDDGAGGDELVN